MIIPLKQRAHFYTEASPLSRALRDGQPKHLNFLAVLRHSVLFKGISHFVVVYERRWRRSLLKYVWTFKIYPGWVFTFRKPVCLRLILLQKRKLLCRRMYIKTTSPPPNRVLRQNINLKNSANGRKQCSGYIKTEIRAANFSRSFTPIIPENRKISSCYICEISFQKGFLKRYKKVSVLSLIHIWRCRR